MSSDPSPKSRKPRSKSNADFKAGFSDPLRPLPQSLEAEKALLGSILQAPLQVLDDCITRQVTAGHFIHPVHSLIYSVLMEMHEKRMPIDLVSLTQFLADSGRLEDAGGAVLVTDLFTFVPTAANAGFYADVVHEKFLLRQMIGVCSEYTRRSYEEQGEVPLLLSEFESRALSLSKNNAQKQQPTIKHLAIKALETIETLKRSDGGVTGLATGFPDLDRQTNGLHPGEMTVLAARPSMGKTALAMNIVEHVALEQEKCAAVFSLEMSGEQLVLRMLCSAARIDLKRVAMGFLDHGEMKRIVAATNRISKARIFVDDTPGLSILDLQSRARRLHSQHHLDLIMIDYLQLMKSHSRRGQENRQIEVSEVSQGVKALAKELSLPIIVLAQLNRNPDARADGKPKLSDLRESGSIEQDADLVGLLWRHAPYAGEDEKEEAAGKAELDIAKQRNGPIGKIPLTFLPEFTRFEPATEHRD